MQTPASDAISTILLAKSPSGFSDKIDTVLRPSQPDGRVQSVSAAHQRNLVHQRAVRQIAQVRNGLDHDVSYHFAYTKNTQTIPLFPWSISTTELDSQKGYGIAAVDIFSPVPSTGSSRT